jgi:hypothetical protein
LQQRLGYSEDALAAKLLSGAEAQFTDFVRERSFSHDRGCIFVIPSGEHKPAYIYM